MRGSFRCALAGLVAAASVVATPVDSRTLLQKPKTPIDAATYANLVKYAAFPSFANSLQNQNCTNPPAGTAVEHYYNNSATDTQAAIFRSDSDRSVIVGVPGTNSQQDYDTDFTFVPVPYLSPAVVCVGCLVHVGFLAAWNSIVSDVEAGVKDVLARHPGYSVVVAGTSLGGAIGQLAFATLKAAGLPVVAAYTYGQPRVGNPLYADYIDYLAGANDTEAGIFHRVTHYNDGVPQLPPILLGGFWHSRTEYWESADTPSLETTYRCYGQEPADCNDQAGGVGINAAHGGYAGGHYACET